jgi:short-subunit dehydrogenase
MAYPSQKFLVVQFDATDADKVEAVSSELAKQYEIGMVVTNAVMTPKPGPFLDADMQDVRKSISLNVRAIAEMVYVFGTEMRKRKRGGFILVSSVASCLGHNNMATYSSTKSFLNLFGETLWLEGKTDNIDFITAVVGQTSTPSLDDFLNPEARVRLLETSPEDVAKETLWWVPPARPAAGVF